MYSEKISAPYVHLKSVSMKVIDFIYNSNASKRNDKLHGLIIDITKPGDITTAVTIMQMFE